MATRRTAQTIATATLGALALIACASTTPGTFFEAHEFDTAHWVPKVDRFVVVVDDSLTMADRYQRQIKIERERDLLRSLNASIPELAYDFGLRTFGQGRCLPRERTTMIAGIARYTTAAMASAIAELECVGGYSPLHLALEAGLDDLAGGDGPRALIAISDGRHMGDREITAARRLKDRFGDDLCIYPVLIGNDRRGRQVLDEIASIGGCGALVNADELAARAAMGRFVEQALLWPDADGDGVPDHLDRCPDTPTGVEVDAEGCPPDGDGDGVPDYLDRCPGTPAGTEVDAEGCPFDGDGDGVPDHLDRCPDTPAGTEVGDDGCPLAPERPATPDWPIEGSVLFAVDEWTLDAADREVLDAVAGYLADNPDVVVEIGGHTDATGPLRWNMTLSEWRAASAKKYLVAKGIAADRLTTKGYGPHQPAASNDNRADRARNRRVEFRPSWR